MNDMMKARKSGHVKLVLLGGTVTMAVVTWIFVKWFVGVAFVVLSLYLFWGVLKSFAAGGQRF